MAAEEIAPHVNHHSNMLSVVEKSGFGEKITGNGQSKTNEQKLFRRGGISQPPGSLVQRRYSVPSVPFGQANVALLQTGVVAHGSVSF